MPNITRGGDMAGVLRYLITREEGQKVGEPGVHTEPHLVAGSPAVMAFWGADELAKEQAAPIARELDHPRRVFGTRVTVPKRDKEGHVVGRQDAHVWHCSLSLRPDEEALSDERWAHIAEEFIAGMGFDDGEAAACRWAAIHHGLSKAGNDHIHVVVGLVREDGSKARVNRDQPRAQRLAGQLERRHGLQVLESRETGHTSRGYTPRDQALDEAAADWAPAMRGERTGRGQLERSVRACATAAASEADFVRLLRSQGLRVKPRFAAGRADRVGGYAVALPATSGKAPAWYSGGRLARDLTLPQIRAAAGWEESPEADAAAVAEWNAVWRKQDTVGKTQLPSRDGAQWEQASRELGALREQLRAIGPDDRAEWARIAGDAAGVLAAWSLENEREPGPLAAAAAALGRSAQLPAWQARTARRVRAPSARGAALLFAAAARPSNGPLGWMVLLEQMANLAKALHDAHAARGDLQRAQEIERAVRGELQEVHATLSREASGVRSTLDPEELRAAETARRGQLPLRPGASPLPGAPAEPPKRPPVTRPPDRDRQRDRGSER